MTVVCDHFTGKVIWAAKGRSKAVVEFFDVLGPNGRQLRFVTCDGAEWIRAVVTERAPKRSICLDTFHVISWATDALDQVRRDEWNRFRRRRRQRSQGDQGAAVGVVTELGEPLACEKEVIREWPERTAHVPRVATQRGT